MSQPTFEYGVDTRAGGSVISVKPEATLRVEVERLNGSVVAVEVEYPEIVLTLEAARSLLPGDHDGCI